MATHRHSCYKYMKVALLKYIDLIFWHFTTKFSKHYHEHIQLHIFRSTNWQLLNAFLGARQQINGMINITICRLWIKWKICGFCPNISIHKKTNIKVIKVRSINYVSFTIIKLKEIITPCYSRDKNFNQILRRLKTYTAQYGHLLANDYEIVN